MSGTCHYKGQYAFAYSTAKNTMIQTQDFSGKFLPEGVFWDYFCVYIATYFVYLKEISPG